ncbi:MAG: hypothetical protein ACI9HK_004603, partial [Pirellulaceae bacterium]
MHSAELNTAVAPPANDKLHSQWPVVCNSAIIRFVRKADVYLGLGLVALHCKFLVEI